MVSRVLLLAAVLGVFASTGRAQPAPRTQAVSGDTTTAAHPANQEPYATERSIAYHILKTPAYVLYGATRPLGWAVRYVEREFPALFEPTLPIRGVVPLIELGGPVGVSAGGALFDNALFGSSHSARLEGVYGSRNFYEVEALYSIPDPLGDGSAFAVDVELETQPRDRFFLGGRLSEDPQDEVEFFARRLLGGPEVRYRLTPRMQVRHAVQYRHANVKPADSRLGERFAARAPDLPGLGVQNSVALRTEWTLDARHRERARHTRGTLLRIEGAYNHDVGGGQFRYARYVAELQQYLPVPALPAGRRVVLRGRVEQVEPTLRGDAVPFYAQPTLGSTEALRGFPPERFAGNGALVVNAEYRYPIWDLWDAVVFVDAGQVFDELEDVNVRDFEVGYGGGIHLLSPKSLSFRFEVAGSTDGIRVLLTVDPAFRSLF